MMQNKVVNSRPCWLESHIKSARYYTGGLLRLRWRNRSRRRNLDYLVPLRATLKDRWIA